MNIEKTRHDHCPECNPRYHFANSPFSFAEEINEIDGEALYSCDDCGANVWITTEVLYD